MFELIGEMNVDSGLLMVGDPCYHIAIEKHEDWIKWLEANDRGNTPQMKHANGSPGAGVLMNTVYGDGTYPVYKVGKGSFVVITEFTNHYGDAANDLRALASELERQQKEYEEDET